ncbi:hypothetical protein [Herminiimonas arsenitoxidans]|uniref:hypothetical protein n=1 Tax=Herminiimonas arsenitoxidans TaxID=1809410 RepID=UPI0009708CCB|nr:hypothetical protein [Herminiimonas arsenitoxidans]
MNRIDQAISELASAFCLLKQHDEQLYIKALQSLVALALSEERVDRATSIEKDMQYVGQILSNTRRVRSEGGSSVLEFPCRRKSDRRIASR